MDRLFNRLMVGQTNKNFTSLSHLASGSFSGLISTAITVSNTDAKGIELPPHPQNKSNARFDLRGRADLDGDVDCLERNVIIFFFFFSDFLISERYLLNQEIRKKEEKVNNIPF